MMIILYVLGAIILALLVSYFVLPKALYDLMTALLRLRGGMRLKKIRVGDNIWPYLEGGRRDGVPIILLHGFGGDKDNWSIYAPHITKHHRVIAPDLPGFGENDRSLDRDYDVATQAHRLNAFLDAMNINKCHIGGNSMGGFIALQFALEYPQKISSLTLFNNAGVVGENKSELQVAAEKGENVLALESLSDVDRLMSFVAYKPVAMPKNFKKLFYAEAAEHRDLLDKIFWQIAGSGINHPLNDRLSEVTAPSLIIWGRHDRLIDVSCVDVLDQGLKNSEAVILEETGHIPMIEKPKDTASAQLAFLAKH
ncbi:alpha/beta fold hydrolase [Parasphingorhabdus cellanae]|uniref:Alpha/beta fold hydrolase n=1 Tax=Parasphingorhabdus cellanae TaxID=2806553 RepID=A0ABX7T390_9SPHN|nr:alpha/beta fold hydrolase [Parasphingorhabdus cellanae]QTD56029.1 alpha/beta fold hydrolase [Parasphingorhabdus cellanae]